MKPVHAFISVLFITILGITPFLRNGTCQASSVTVAVLPFENLNRDSTYGLLSRGMCESLIEGLSSVKSLTLVERAQVEKTLKEQALGLTGVIDEKTAPKTGQLLGAKYVVMGSYQVIGNQVKITARFVNVETGEIDQSKIVSVTGRYPDQVFDLQSQIASKLVANFNVAASKAETDRMATVLKSTQNFTAYELFIKGLNAWLLGTETGNQEAITYYRKAIELDPNYALAYNNLGASLNEHGKYGEAIAAYRKVIELKPDPYLAPAYSNLGMALADQGKYEEAIAAYRKAIELKPDDAYIYYNGLGVTLMQQGKDQEAIVAYRKAIELNPAYADAYSNLGAAFNAQGKYGEAITAYRKAIELKPDDADAYSNLGVVLKKQEKYEEAIAAYRKAIELKPDFSEAYYNLGINLKKQGKYGEAIVAYRKAIELNPDFTNALENLAIVLDAKGVRKEAREYWERAFKLEKDPERVEWIMKRLAEP